MSLLFKIASTEDEFEQIIQLNYRTFVEEIPQHEENIDRKLVDKFHDENTYLICVKDEKVIGMLCVRTNRPFSLDGKIGEIEQHLEKGTNHPVEIRLLAVDQEHRNNPRIFFGLAQTLIRYCLKRGYDLAVISGTTRQIHLYEQLGFKKFACLTGTGEAVFQPMYLTRKTFEEGIAGRFLKDPVNFLPGPSTINAKVTEAFVKTPISHRSVAYMELFAEIKTKLKDLVHAKNVQILQGTGTLANDAIAAQLSLIGGKGLILHNGEFGERLTKHAQTFQLLFDSFTAQYGDAFSYEKLEEVFAENQYTWVWFVHSETSTGVLNDLERIKEICKKYHVKIAVDCISSIGVVPIHLEEVDFASAVSGKALASYTGLSFVFHKENVKENPKLPRYLDIGLYEDKDGTPFTQSSNLLLALNQALDRYEEKGVVYAQIKERYTLIRKGMESFGLEVLANHEDASPCILTVVLPNKTNIREIGENLFLNGLNVHYESEYLATKGWLQIACINDTAEKDIQKFLTIFGKLL